MTHSGMTERQVLKFFNSWNDAVKAAGFEPYTTNAKVDDAALLENWAEVVRNLRGIPTVVRYGRVGRYSTSLFSVRFGVWSDLPNVFRTFAEGKPEWADVVALLPAPNSPSLEASPLLPELSSPVFRTKHSKLDGRPTYGNPIDFRGLRHEPVNEQGVVFLFGMVAKEIGYMVEAVQTGYPDCEAKRQIAANTWQRVRIEFEYESRNFRDHGHAQDGCDVIVCWRHNWPECPPSLEVVELASIIQTLSKSED
jgi:hypothetical protein